ncbi:hypothetical protein LJB82_03415 [Desulfovibrio sp. OttesenSCG-928-M16]|nr:hypothetical protein [Desulfovibrio sp. OttesenSCG-928-M16]
MAGLWRLGRLDEEYFNALLPGATDEKEPAPDDGKLFQSRGALLALPKALRLRLYKRTLDDMGPGQARLDGLLALDASLTAGDKPAEHRFTGNKKALVDRRGVTWIPYSASASSSSTA